MESGNTQASNPSVTGLRFLANHAPLPICKSFVKSCGGRPKLPIFYKPATAQNRFPDSIVIEPAPQAAT